MAESSGITIIEPVSLPSGAGVDYAGGDVRHVSETIDELSGRSISATTRQLAERDNLLAAAVNQLIAAVNNKDQVDNIPLPAVKVAPGDTVTVTSLRIPAGFEMRILNAVVNSAPSGVVRLDVLYNQGVYGQLTGDEIVVSTLSEFTDGTSFKASGELIVRYINTSGRTAEAVASITVTQRPVGAQKGGIIGPGATGQQGERGPQGPVGPQGSAGLPGSAGAIGINYRGSWSGTTNYSQRDSTVYDGSTFYAIAANLNKVPPAPDLAPSAFWNLLARKGSTGPQGTQGTQGTQGPQGPVSSPFYDIRAGLTSVVTGAGFVAGTTEDGYEAPSAGSTYSFPWTESTIFGGVPASTVDGVHQVRGKRKLIYRGPLSVTLPTWSDGASGTWTADDISVSATMHGTYESFGTLVPGLTVVEEFGTVVTVDVNTPNPSKVYLGFSGFKGI